MWATNPMKANAIKILEHNGCTYEQTIFTWLKTKPDGTPFLLEGKFTRTCTEELLVGTRGNINRFLKENKKHMPPQA